MKDYLNVFRAVGDRVIAIKRTIKERESSLIIVGKSEFPLAVYVVSVGGGVNGISIDIEQGETILVSRYSEFEHDNENYLMINPIDILAVIE